MRNKGVHEKQRGQEPFYTTTGKESNPMNNLLMDKNGVRSHFRAPSALARTHFKKRGLTPLSRGGFTLMELVVGMTAGVIVFALAINTVEQTMKVSRDASAQSEHRLAVARFGQHLRSDAHSASAIESANQDSLVRLTLTGESLPKIVYTFDGSTITRESPSTTSTNVLRETYRLASNCKVRIDQADSERVSVSVLRQIPDGEMLDSRIAARAARWLPLQPFKKGE